MNCRPLPGQRPSTHNRLQPWASTHLALQRQREALQAAAVQHFHPGIASCLFCLTQKLGSINWAGRRLGGHRCRRRILLSLRRRLPAV